MSAPRIRRVFSIWQPLLLKRQTGNRYSACWTGRRFWKTILPAMLTTILNICAAAAIKVCSGQAPISAPIWNPETGDVIVFFYTFDITEQKLKEQLLHKIASLDYDVIVEIDIRKDIFRGLTFESSGMGPAWQELHFQEKIRRTAGSFMDEAAAQEYLKQLDYDYMQDMLGSRKLTLLVWR